MNLPLVSIIIPTYNRAHLIGETLDSISNQTYQNWECIIVDDGSDDATQEVVSRYVVKDNRFKFYNRPFEMQKGACSCRNYGFELSKGYYINWFDSDDIMLADFLIFKVEAFTANYDFVIGTGFYWYSDKNLKEFIDLKISSYLFRDYLMWKAHILTPSLLFKRSFLLDKKLFNVNIRRGQETDFFSRLFFQKTNDKYIILNEPLFLYRQHGETKTAKNKSYVFEYKESQAYISIENMKRSLLIGDRELIKYYYKAIIDLFFRALDNNHLKNAKFILRSFISILIKKRKSIAFLFFILGKFFILIRRGSYRAEKYFKSFDF